MEMARLRQEARKHASSSSFYPPARPASAKPEAIAALAGSAPAVQHSARDATTATLPPPRVIVFGSAAMDLTSHSAHPLSPRSTTPGSIYLTPGGVGRNIAEAAQNLLPPNAVMLVSPLGTDAPDVPDAVGKMLLLEMKEAGMRTDGLVLLTGERSAACSLVLEGDKDLVNGVADMGIVERLTADVVSREVLWLIGLGAESAGGRSNRQAPAEADCLRLQPTRGGSAIDPDNRAKGAHTK